MTVRLAYIINKGKVKVCIANEQGREVVIAQLDEGEHFGEMSLIDEKPRSASIITRTACEISLIQKDEFQRMLASNPELSLTVMRGLSERLRLADRKIETLALMDVYGRIARALLDLAVDLGDGREAGRRAEPRPARLRLDLHSRDAVDAREGRVGDRVPAICGVDEDGRAAAAVAIRDRRRDGRVVADGRLRGIPENNGIKRWR